ncbi:MAG: rhamnogalacturonan acetylesterase [Phycisphaerae bacterium]|nr:rhamnogalacturonan acetylesterase [Phycisphaerae bacterium]
MKLSACIRRSLGILVLVAAASGAGSGCRVTTPGDRQEDARTGEAHPTLSVAIVGDSTVADYADSSDRRGWGQMLPPFFTENVRFTNFARSGRSSKSFIREGLWAKVLAAKPDYVLIQFGHNDCPGKGERSTDPAGDFQDYLRRYIDDSRSIGATPILTTPVTRRNFGSDGRIRTTLTPYSDAMKKVASQKHVDLVDLHAESIALLNRLGDAGSAHLNCSPKDHTHWSPEGARVMAEIVARALPPDGLGRYARVRPPSRR